MSSEDSDDRKTLSEMSQKTTKQRKETTKDKQKMTAKDVRNVFSPLIC